MQQDKISIDLKLPTRWEDLDNPLTFGKKKKHFSFCSHSIADLTDKQLRYVFVLLAQGYTATEVKAYCLHRWAGLKVLHRYGNNGWACRHGKQEFRSSRNSGCVSAILNKFRLRSTCTEFFLAAEQVERATHALGWLDNVPIMPVRIARIGRHRAVLADFEGVPFETFIVCDNLYQGYLATKQDELLDELASHLYSSKFRVESLGFRDLLGRLIPPYILHFTQTERISVFYWLASLKGFLAKVFKHFFQPAAGASAAAGSRASITLR
ncbi:MAG: hypothetical protein IJ160_09515 [Muribaculaceae bacterium]|nr:hypothetical protein [Muribaculaceae bacterium]